MRTDLQRVTPLTDPNYAERLSGFASACWPQFMLHDPVADELWDHLENEFGAFQMALFDADGEPAAMLNSVPLHWDSPLAKLPDDGWDFAMRQAVNGLLNGQTPNMLCAIQVAIHPRYRGSGLSTVMLQEMRKIAAAHGFGRLIAPVRPSEKALHPKVPMEEYIRWVRPDGMPADAWLRVHARAGASIIKVAPRSMEISGSLQEWRSWTSLPFDTDGEVLVPGALSPVQVDLAKQRAVYLEPNVWMCHELK